MGWVEKPSDKHGGLATSDGPLDLVRPGENSNRCGNVSIAGRPGIAYMFFHRGRRAIFEVSLELELELGWYEPRGTKFIVDRWRGPQTSRVAGRFAHVICAKYMIDDVPSLY